MTGNAAGPPRKSSKALAACGTRAVALTPAVNVM
jgi:hypothetical protein